MCVGVEKGCIARVRLSVHRASRDQYFQMSPLPTSPAGLESSPSGQASSVSVSPCPSSTSYTRSA